MDDIVLRGMAKWPNVPAVYGWLSLTRRGQWLIKGEPITNPTVSGFIGRNYERGADGAWFFQNGPQRVFVTLDYTPFVYRVLPGETGSIVLEAHTGARANAVSGAWLDEQGVLLIETEHGVGSIHDSDLDAAALAFVDERGGALDEDALDAAIERLEHGKAAPLWLRFGENAVKVEPIASQRVATRFNFLPSPRAPEDHPECT